MFVLDGRLHWSATDLVAAGECEYALLRELDHKLGWIDDLLPDDDPFLRHLARLGDRHEERLLTRFERERTVVRLAHLQAPYTLDALAAAREATVEAFAAAPEVVYQATFFDGEFFGYADFVERAGDGWLVCDAKLARSAKPKALIQLGAYADQISALGLPLSKTVSLLLGNGERADFRLADIWPVFAERREHLRELLADHQAGGAPVAWSDDRVVACGRCPECDAAVTRAQDVMLVAGMQMKYRARLHTVGVTTISDLAKATTAPEDMTEGMFAKLRAQAALQWRQMQAGEGAPPEYELTPDAATLLRLVPEPSAGDLFFDFEGDPLYDEGDPSQAGLEYLWGVLDTSGRYQPFWAHDARQERAAFLAFMDLVAQQRAAHPDMHIYHYAPYETTALKRLAIRFQAREEELDDLLRGQVFVDLYAIVRGAIRISQRSYSIKKLEPLYMGDQLRDGDVADGAGSIVAYHDYRDSLADEPARAAEILESLADYNEYDCVSTLRLRDWLLERAIEAGVRDETPPGRRDLGAQEAQREASEDDALFVALMAKAGPEQRVDRTAQEQAYAMLAAALAYYPRERKQFWWEHYDRLAHPIEGSPDERDVYVVESASIVEDWAHPGGRARNLRWSLRLTGDWGPGSRAADQALVVYRAKESGLPEAGGSLYAALAAERVEPAAGDGRVVRLTESRRPGETTDALPVALVPAAPPNTKNIEAAIREIAAAAAGGPALPALAAVDLLVRRPPRLLAGGGLPDRRVTVDHVVDVLRKLDDSYLAIQGPPGTGKTYLGSWVIGDLVARHGWRVGVVAQSHAVVENMLASIIKAGLDPALVAKTKTEASSPTWTPLEKLRPFLDGTTRGCVVGGTAWDFAAETRVARGSLDLLVVEEAGQFSLAATLGASVAARRLLLLGDPQQLPQVSQGVHPEPVEQSALGWLMHGHETIPAGIGYFLETSYRMHPALCAKVSTLSYDDRLVSAEPAVERSLAGVDPGLLVVEIDHTGNRTESPQEADEVVAQVRAHLGALWSDPADAAAPRPLGQSDVLVVAPYNAQVERIRTALDAAGLREVQVGTVDRFQGREAPVVIVSMTASSYGDVPRGVGFLLNRNRLNVAVSRAQWRAILIRSKALTGFVPRSAAGVLELGAFIGLGRGGLDVDQPAPGDQTSKSSWVDTRASSMLPSGNTQ